MKYDAIVIGAGQSGPQLAAFLAGRGEHIALAEGATIGGSCVNYGCTPTKAMRASAQVAYQANRGAEYGIQIPEVKVDFRAVMARKDHIVSNSRNGLVGWLESHETLDIYYDYASFTGKIGDFFQVQAGEHLLEAPRVYLNVGTRGVAPPVEGLDDVDYLTNIHLMHLEEQPEHLVILGGGYIGLEIGQIFCRFGSKVTLVEFAPHVAVREDKEVSEEIEQVLRGEGVEILTNHKAVKAQQHRDGTIILTVENRNDGSTKTVSGSHLLVAAGRRPNSDSLNLEVVGVEVDERGFVLTNGKLETNVAGIYAMGDTNGRGAFTHTSYHDYEIVRDNYLGADRNADDRNMAYAMYTDPPMGRVGMNEREARESGRNVLSMTHHARHIGRAKQDGQTNGLVKLIVDADTEEFLGALAFIMHGDEVVQVVSNFMTTGASYKLMQEALPIHPTIGEFFPTWLSRLKPLK